jgi:hypothetical protein
VNVEVLAVDREQGTVRIVCCDRLVSAHWEGAAPDIGPAIVEVDVPGTAWSTLLTEHPDGVPAIVTDYEADGTAQLSLIDGAHILVVTTDEPPFGVIGTRVTLPPTGWTLYPVDY